jgi:hypothetical protein
MFDYNALQLRNKVITVNTVCYSIILYRQAFFCLGQLSFRQCRDKSRPPGLVNLVNSYSMQLIVFEICTSTRDLVRFYIWFNKVRTGFFKGRHCSSRVNFKCSENLFQSLSICFLHTRYESMELGCVT